MDFEAIIKGALTSLMNELRPVIQKQAERIQAQADHLAGLEAELAIVRQVVKSQEDENPDIAGIVSAAIAPLQKDLADVREEIEVVRAVKGEKGDRGEKGDAGDPAEPPDFTALMQKELGEYVQVITAQVNEGVRSTRTLAREEMKAELARVAEEAAEQVAVLKAALVEEVRTALAKVKDGEPGVKGDTGAKGEAGVSIAEVSRDGDLLNVKLSDGSVKSVTLRDGTDGVGVAGALIDRSGSLVVTLSDGKTVPLGEVIGKDGAAGAAGFSLDDLEIEQIDRKSVELRFKRGELEVTRTLRLPGMVYRGVHKDGEAYEEGDTVTSGGSLWVALKDATTKPGIEGGSEWQLAVKRGRDGRDVTQPKSIPPKGPVPL
jgi:hypothetical protein